MQANLNACEENMSSSSSLKIVVLSTSSFFVLLLIELTLLFFLYSHCLFVNDVGVVVLLLPCCQEQIITKFQACEKPWNVFANSN